MSTPYFYRGHVISVYDADTVTIEFDLGFHVNLTEKVRLYGINAPEVRGEQRPAGLEARDALSGHLLGRNVFLRTYKDKKGKYGRWLGTIYRVDEDGNAEPQSINDWLVSNGYALLADY